MAGEGNGFKLITVHDDEEELVVHAGSGKPSAATDAAQAPTAAQAPEPESEHAQQPASDPAAAPETSAKQEALRRKAAELEKAEADLQDPHAHARTRIYVLAALALLVVAVVVYTLAMHS